MGLIYRAHLPDGRSYIGQTTKTLNRRKSCHLSRARTSPGNNHFLSALNKYEFQWEILHNNVDITNLDYLECIEIERFDSIKNGFNKATGGKVIRGFKHTDTFKQQMSEKRRGIPQPKLKGRKLAAAQIENLRRANSRPKTQQHKEKIRTAMLKRWANRNLTQ